MIRSLFLCINLFANLSLSAIAPLDAALVHFDKSFYVSGEVVWYKLYLPASAQGKDFSVQVVVVNGGGVSVGKMFLAVEKNASCQGHFSLPFNAESGVYTFVFTASRKDGTTDELLRASIPVYNDLNITVEKTAVQPVSVGTPTNPPNELKVSVQVVSDGLPAPRQTVRLKINVADQMGNPVSAEGSASVTDDELCGGKVLFADNFQMGGTVTSGAEWLPGVYLSGLVKSNFGNLMTSSLLPVLDLETHQLYFTKSAQGVFTLQMPAFTGVHRLQMVGVVEEPFKVTWNEAMNKSSKQQLAYTAGILQYLDLSRKRKKIYQFYGLQDTELKLQAAALKPIEWKGKQFYKVQNYERFPDLATFFQEIIWRVKFVMKGERFTAKMYNVETHTDFEEPPLFIVDEKATYDADFIAKLDPAGIETIELLFEPKLMRKYYPAIGGGGVVRIKTLLGNQSLPAEKESEIISLSGLSLPATFPVVQPNAAEPILHPVVFWQPSFTTDKNGAYVLSFVQTDDRSTFCAEVLVQGPDGRRGYARFCYKVE